MFFVGFSSFLRKKNTSAQNPSDDTAEEGRLCGRSLRAWERCGKMPISMIKHVKKM
jgi:hypothetical protein